MRGEGEGLALDFTFEHGQVYHCFSLTLFLEPRSLTCAALLLSLQLGVERYFAMDIITYGLLPVLFVSLWFFTSYMSRTFPGLRGKRICLLIAHPDDEAMFFAPALLALTRPELGNHLKILCLSSGNADGLGSVRKNELVASGLQLGVRSASDILVLDDERFRDSMTATWDTKAITGLLTSTFAPKMASIKPNQKPEANIDVLITFDRNGVSGHPNHKSLYHGAVAFVTSIASRHAGWETPIKLYTLPSVNIVRKYGSILDVVTTISTIIFSKRPAGNYPTPLLFISNIFDYRKAQTAMTTAHKSQMVWFRWGWIGISRYMIVNDLHLEKGV